MTAVLVFLTFADAVVLAVALYGLRRDQDRDLAVLSLACRISERRNGDRSPPCTLDSNRSY